MGYGGIARYFLLFIKKPQEIVLRFSGLVEQLKREFGTFACLCNDALLGLA